MKAFALTSADQPAALVDQVAAGTLVIRIQQTFPLTEASTALSAFMAGTLGKIVLTIA